MINGTKSVSASIQLPFILTVIFIVISVSLSCQVQKCNNIWYFSQFAGLDFNFGSPVALNNSAMNTAEGSASIADTNGDLMFYTDGSTIWNKVHSIMTNGTGLMGHSSSTQSAIIVPKPLSNNLYYVFTLDAFGGANGFRYSIVDMLGSGGLGSVTNSNIAICTPVTEKICAIRHSNGIDIWIVVHQWQNANFNSYLLTPTGLTMIPVISVVGTAHQNSSTPNNNAIGYMKSSPDGTKIALGICDTRIYELFEFDKQTGQLSNPITFPNPDGSTSSSRAYGLEFSPNGNFLYLKNFYSSNVYQYDLSNYNQTNILASQTLIGTVSGNGIYFTGAMQLGPDGKIYIIKHNESSLAAINEPNNSGSACNFVDNAVSLGSGVGVLGLPTLVSYALLQNAILSNGCFPGAFNFWIQDTSFVQSLHWDFGDNSTLADTSGLINPVYTYSQAGTYIITVELTQIGGNTSTYSYTLIIPPLTDLITPDTVSICEGNSVNIITNGNFSNYLWSNGATSSSITVTPGDSTVYYITVSENGCNTIDSLIVFVNPIPIASAWPDTAICLGQNVVLHGSGGLSYLWNTGAIIENINLQPLLTTTYYLTVTSYGCSSTDSVTITVNPLPYPNLGPDSSICENNPVVIAPGIFSSYEWSGGSTMPQLTVNATGTYWVKVFNEFGCSASDTIHLVFGLNPIVNIAYNPPVGCEPLIVDFVNLTVPPALYYTWSFGDGQTSTVVNPTHTYLFPGIYTVMLEAISSSNCQGSGTFPNIITVYKTPVAGFYPNPISSSIFNPEITFVDQSSFAEHHLWYFGDGFTSTDINPVHIYSDTGVYNITQIVNTPGGCADTAYGQVHIRGYFTIYIPNAFTPNFDGLNDDFGPQGVGWGKYKVFSMLIFNRWGELIYETNDPSKPWNGEKFNNGEICMDGSYIYRIRLQPEGENVMQYSGYVILLR